MTKLWLCVAAIVASTIPASAQTSSASTFSASIGRAQSDDDRRMQGPIGAAKLVQDRSESEGEARERLDEVLVSSEERDHAPVTSKLRERGSRAAWMREDR
jgi:hypothetical protein